MTLLLLALLVEVVASKIVREQCHKRCRHIVHLPPGSVRVHIAESE